ncbi:hypothetical protein BI364_07700 [Acidihalobacter yilgarnensis]|uniref:Uncharacterized protein n=1 Tax=Acidihalobacter yilgarnensis TaxID=2819280 RepID=A0A1D8IN21_9GAMM|nr:hypothetical protein BI364_07700 [Acidihalobacter yilgarnensis]
MGFKGNLFVITRYLVSLWVHAHVSRFSRNFGSSVLIEVNLGKRAVYEQVVGDGCVSNEKSPLERGFTFPGRSKRAQERMLDSACA